MKKTIHLPGLNGLRAIAAFGVVFSHISIKLNSFGVTPINFGVDVQGNPKGYMLAPYGVSIFFALSGFLITYLLLHEKALQPISIKKFYVRRILRIWPLYYLYFFIVIAAYLAFHNYFPAQSSWFYIFLCANVPVLLDRPIPLVAHYWSLGVEEQYYAFWPWIVKLTKKNLLKISLFMLTGFFILKIIFYIINVKLHNSMPLYIMSMFRFQCMLIGAVGAIFFYNNHKIFMAIASHLITQILSWLVIVLIVLNVFHVVSVIDHEIVCAVTVFLIVAQSTKRNRIINLDTETFDFFGKISYGIYVIHPLVIFFAAELWTQLNIDFLKNYFAIYTIVFAAVVLVSYLSYNYYEKWFLKLKLNYTAVKSSSTKHFSE